MHKRLVHIIFAMLLLVGAQPLLAQKGKLKGKTGQTDGGKGKAKGKGDLKAAFQNSRDTLQATKVVQPEGIVDTFDVSPAYANKISSVTEKDFDDARAEVEQLRAYLAKATAFVDTVPESEAWPESRINAAKAVVVDIERRIVEADTQIAVVQRDLREREKLKAEALKAEKASKAAEGAESEGQSEKAKPAPTPGPTTGGKTGSKDKLKGKSAVKAGAESDDDSGDDGANPLPMPETGTPQPKSGKGALKAKPDADVEEDVDE